jgi:hypothetical protein
LRDPYARGYIAQSKAIGSSIVTERGCESEVAQSYTMNLVCDARLRQIVVGVRGVHRERPLSATLSAHIHRS